MHEYKSPFIWKLYRELYFNIDDHIYDFEFIIKGIKDNKLISKPIHTLNQDVEEIEIKDPIIKVKKKINL